MACQGWHTTDRHSRTHSKDNWITHPETVRTDLSGIKVTCLSSCSAGHHGNCTLNAVGGCGVTCALNQCDPCPAGTAVATDGARSLDECVQCSKGYWASSDGTATCDGPCPAGSFVTSTAGDSDGIGVTTRGERGWRLTRVCAGFALLVASPARRALNLRSPHPNPRHPLRILSRGAFQREARSRLVYELRGGEILPRRRLVVLHMP